MAHPRIIARVSPAPTGDFGVLTFEFRGRTFARALDTREEIDLANELAGIVNILAALEAFDRATREFQHANLTSADALSLRADMLRQLADEAERRNRGRAA